MVKPKRVQRKRTKGWKMPPNTVCVTRPTKWGNPLRCGPTVTKAKAVEMYRAMLDRDYRKMREFPWTFGAQLSHGFAPTRHDARRELRGRDLACWCKPGEPCHADVLLEIANAD